jgi:tetratricopeptide (TPR) repeat protein
MKKVLFCAFCLIGCENEYCSLRKVNESVLDLKTSEISQMTIQLDSLGLLPCSNFETYNLISNKFLQLENWERAVYWGKKSIQSGGDQNSSNYRYVSEGLRFQGQTDSALYYAIKVTEVCHNNQSNCDEAFNQYMIGLIAFEAEMYTTSFEYFENSLSIYEHSPSRILEKQILHQYICLNLERLGRIEESCQYAKRFVPEYYFGSNCKN